MIVCDNLFKHQLDLPSTVQTSRIVGHKKLLTTECKFSHKRSTLVVLIHFARAEKVLREERTSSVEKQGLLHDSKLANK